MDEEPITERAQRLVCDECGRTSDLEALDWEGHLGRENDGSVTVIFFCPDCAESIGLR